VFVTEKQELSAGFPEAATRLAELTRGSSLRGLSENVYAGGVEYLMRVGPLGAVPGASRLVRVRFAEPLYRYGMMTVSLRWEASGVTGGMFPALDADIRLCEGEDDKATVELTGSYRPPLGTVGAELDRLVLRTVAAATIRTLLSKIVDVLDGDKEGAAFLEAWSPEPPAAEPPAQAAFVAWPAAEAAG
jgi:hypothetical protein